MKRFMSDRETDYGNLHHNERRGDFLWDAKGEDGHRWVYDPMPAPIDKNKGGRGGQGGKAPEVPLFDPWELMSTLMQAQREAREAAYQAGVRQQKQNYEFAAAQLDEGTDQALREAYINKMMSLRDLPQRLAAQGLTGGMSETAAAGLYNNYGDARARLEAERQSQLAQLLNTLQSNLAQLEMEKTTGAAADLMKLAPQLTRLTVPAGPAALSLTQGEDKSPAAAMRRLRIALGLEEEE